MPLVLTYKSIRSALAVFLAIYSNAIAAFPSHCAADEYAILDSWMGEVHATDGGWRNTRNGKFLSLCADRKTEPFTKVTYRYGVLGRVEFEVVATPRAQFKIASLELVPRVGMEVIFFKKGNHTYYVSVATGQGHGVGLDVFKGSKSIASHFSGNDEGRDYQLGPAEIDFMSHRSRSSVFISEKPKHVLH
jgi:hypothetical protein